MVEDGNRATGKSALRKKRGALHEEHDIVCADNIGNTLIGIGHWSVLCLNSVCEIRWGLA